MILTVNGNDLETLGYHIASLEGWNAAVQFSYPSTPVPRLVGHLVGSTPTSPPRVVRIGLIVTAASAAAADTAVNELLALFTGTVEIVFGDSPDKSLSGVLTSVSGGLASPNSWFYDYSRRVDLEVTCHDPAKYDTTESVVNLSTSAADIPVGTLASGGVIRINGAATNPVIAYKNFAGTTVQTMTLTASIASGDWVEVDTDLFTVTKSVSGVESNALDYWTAGDFFWAEPQDAEYGSASWPTITLSFGTGTFTYRRRWMS